MPHVTRVLAVGRCLLFSSLVAAAPAAPRLPEPPAKASAASPVTEGRARVTATLVTDVASVTPGDSFRAGILFTLEPGWHIYWQYPGDAGYPTEVAWQAGDAMLGGLQWPAPQVFVESDGLTTYGYEKEVLLLANATVSDSVGAEVGLVAEARYLACHTLCTPGEVRLQRSVPIGHASEPADAATAALFARWAKRLPEDADAAGVASEAVYDQTPVRPGDDFKVALLLRGSAPLDAAEHLFAPMVGRGLHLRLLETRRHPSVADGLSIIVGGHLDADVDAAALPASWRTVLQLSTRGLALRPIWVQVELPKAAVAAAVSPSAHPVFTAPPDAVAQAPQAGPEPTGGPTLGVWEALALALLGGLVLNLMPCVLPVLAIKVMGATQVGRLGRRAVAMHGLAYVAGVVGTLLALAAVMLGLRAAGTQVGWGFQFQEPAFVAAVSAVLVLFAMNCFGVFEIYTGAAGVDQWAARAHGLRRSALDGVLAVVLATPCSAPILGSAVAYALTQGPLVHLLVFATIGLGLALPFVGLTLLPGWARLLPRPGPWMNHVKALLGFGLLATAVWLVWLIGRFAGVDAVARLLGFLLLTAFVAWVYGLVVQRFIALAWPLAALAVITLAGLGTASLRFPMQAPGEAQASEVLPSQPYSHAAVLAALADGKPVFVDFTADWCITCKYNEQHVLHDPVVLAEMKRYHVVVLRADWTRRDEGIRRTLQSFGRSGVPMYLLYSPVAPDGPQVLPEILTAGLVQEALHRLEPP